MIARSARRRDLRLIPVAGLTWVAAAAAVNHPALAAWLTAVAVTSALSLLVLLVFRRPRRGAAALGVSVIALAFAAATAATVAMAHPAREAVSQLPIDGGRALTVEALVVGKVEPSGHGWSLDAVTHRVTIGDRAHRTSVPIIVRLPVELPGAAPSGGDRPRVDIGAEITVAGTAYRTRPGERAVIVLQASETPTVRSEAAGLLGGASALRGGLRAVTAELPPPAGGLVAGLAVGDTADVSAELDRAMKSSSLAHLTAVSGANCALVVGIAYGCVALAGGGRRLRILIGLVALVGFVVLVSPEPSVVRAAAMAAIAMAALLLGRIGAGVSVLSLAIVLILVFDPWLALSLGFALSAAATASLLLVAGPLADGLSAWMPAPVALAVSVPLAAQLACGPLLILIEPTVPLFGVLANLLAGPAAPAGTVLGLLLCLVSGVPVISDGLAALAWLPAAWIAETARITSCLPGNALAWLPGVPGMVALMLVGGAVVLSLAPIAHRARRWRATAVLILAGCAGAVVAFGPLSTLLERARTPPSWSVAACDVGQGDAVLVRTGDRVALIDTGPEPDALHACLERFSIGHIDLLVLTHFDLDHRGGTSALLSRVSTVLHGPVDSTDAAQVLDDLARGGARLHLAQAGLSGGLGESSWRVLWPRAMPAAYSGNDASVVVEFRGGGVPSIVLLGDLSAGPQSALASELAGSYTIVKVAHHGSADQWPTLYDRISARVALVTVGENSYGHPRAEILEHLAATGSLVVRTDHSGALAMWNDGHRLRVWHERDVAADR